MSRNHFATIEDAEARIERLEEALRPFAEAGERFGVWRNENGIGPEDFRRASAVLRTIPKGLALTTSIPGWTQP